MASARKKQNNKTPKSINLPSSQKKAKHTQNPEGYLSMPMAWHLWSMDETGDWPCDMNTISNIRSRLHEYEKKKWSEALESKHNHPMPPEKIIPRARRRLSELGYEDVANLYQFEIKNGKGKQRLWGFKIYNILQILWWDPNHEIFPPSGHKR